MMDLPVQRIPPSERDVVFGVGVPTPALGVGRGRRLVVLAGGAAAAGGGAGLPGPARGRGALAAVATVAAVGARLEVLEVLDHHAQFAALGAALLHGVCPGVQAQVPLDEDLLALAHRLEQPLCLLAHLAPVPDLHVDEHRDVFPLLRVLVQLPVVDREAELGAGLDIADLDRFRVAGQPADQHHLVEVGHGAFSCDERESPVLSATFSTIHLSAWTRQAPQSESVRFSFSRHARCLSSSRIGYSSFSGGASLRRGPPRRSPRSSPPPPRVGSSSGGGSLTVWRWWACSSRATLSMISTSLGSTCRISVRRIVSLSTKSRSMLARFLPSVRK